MFTPERELVQLCHCACLDANWVSRFGKKALKSEHAKRIKNEAPSLKQRLVEKKGKCEICGTAYKPILQIHHILPISNFGNNDDDNIICVCPNCHKTLHHLYNSLKKTDEDVITAYLGVPKEIREKVWAVVGIYAKKQEEVYEYIKSYDDSDYEDDDQ